MGRGARRETQGARTPWLSARTRERLENREGHHPRRWNSCPWRGRAELLLGQGREGSSQGADDHGSRRGAMGDGARALEAARTGDPLLACRGRAPGEESREHRR
jgi:hypothetical protein